MISARLCLAGACVIALASCSPDGSVTGPTPGDPAHAGPLAVRGNVSLVHDICTTGTVVACAKVVPTVSRLASSTFISLKVWNMQGTEPLDNTGGSTISLIQLFVRQPGFSFFPSPGCDACGWSVQIAGNVLRYGDSTVVPTDASFYDFYSPDFSYADLLPWSNSQLSVGFFGCGAGPFPSDEFGNPVSNAFGTCPAGGQDGYLEWSLDTAQPIRPVDVGYAIWFRTANGQFAGCGYHSRFATPCQFH